MISLRRSDGMWYQHDDAPTYFALRVKQFLNQRLEGRVIGREQHPCPQDLRT